MTKKFVRILAVVGYLVIVSMSSCSLESNEVFTLNIEHPDQEMAEVMLKTNLINQIVPHYTSISFHKPTAVELNVQILQPRTYFQGFRRKLVGNTIWSGSDSQWYTSGLSLNFVVGELWKNVEIHLTREINWSPLVVDDQILYGSNREGGWKLFRYDPFAKVTHTLTPNSLSDTPDNYKYGFSKVAETEKMALLSSGDKPWNYLLDLSDYTLKRMDDQMYNQATYFQLTEQGRLLAYGVSGTTMMQLMIYEIHPDATVTLLYSLKHPNLWFLGPDQQGNFYILELQGPDILRYWDYFEPGKLYSFDPRTMTARLIPEWGQHLNLDTDAYLNNHTVDYFYATGTMMTGYQEKWNDKTDPLTYGKNKGCRFLLVKNGVVVQYPPPVEDPLPFFISECSLSSDGMTLEAKDLEGKWQLWSLDNLRTPLGPLMNANPRNSILWSSNSPQGNGIPFVEQKHLSTGDWVDTVVNFGVTDVRLQGPGLEPVLISAPLGWIP